MIKHIKFTNDGQTQIEINTDDGQIISAPLEGSVWIHEYVREWLAAGNTPDPYVEPERPKVQEVTPHQAQMALLNAGLLDDVESAIESIPDPMEKRIAKIDWEKASTVKRGWPLLVKLATAIGLDDERLDELFEAASKL